MRRSFSTLLSFLIAVSPLESAWAQTRLGRAVPVAPQAGVILPVLGTPLPALSAPPVLPAPAVPSPRVLEVAQPKSRSVAPAVSDKNKTEPDKTGERASAEVSAAFDGTGGNGDAAGGLASEAVKELLRLRGAVQADARKVLQKQMGGDVGDGRLHKDIGRVASRLVKAAGLPKEAVQVFVGNSFLPNAFTTITESEAKFIEKKSSVAKPFRVSNVFLSLGLLRALQTEEQLAFVIAHELSHNWKEHLKGFAGSHEMLGHFHEYEADFEALKLIAAAGYDPRAALDTLYELDKAQDKLAKDYAQFSRRDKGEIAQAMERVRDVHPHADLRRASLLDHLDEALEAYKPGPVPASPLWKARSESARRPSALDRFEARARRAAAEGTMDERLHTLEAFVEREKAKRELGAEENAVVEEAYRDILKEKPDLEGTRSVELSVARGSRGGVVGKGLSGEFVTRQLELAQAPGATLEDFLRAAAGFGPAARRAGALRLMGQVKTRAQLDAMFRALTHGAESLGLGPGETARKVADRLWRSTGRVLSLERKRAALPEEIIDELKAKLSPSWLSDYRGALQVNIVESAFERPERRSKLYAPSQLTLRLRSLDETRRFPVENEDTEVLFKGLDEWGALRYTAGEVKVANDRFVHRYERYHVDGYSAPSERDFLDLTEHFEKGWQPPPALIRILRRDGLFDKFVLLAMDRLEERLNARRKSNVKAAVNRYTVHLDDLMGASLYGVADLAETARVSRLIWERAQKAHAVLKTSGWEYAELQSSQLAANLLATLTVSVRVAVVRLNHSGRRPANDSLKALADVARSIETTLGLEPGERVVLHHASRLAGELSRIPKPGRAAAKADLAYMKALAAAVPDSSHESDEGDRRWWHRRKTQKVRALRASDLLGLLLLTVDEQVPATTRLAAAAMADKLGLLRSDNHGRTVEGILSSRVGDRTVGRWLVEGAVRAAKTEGTLPALVTALLRLNDLQPNFLNPDAGPDVGNGRRAFRGRARLMRRNEPFRTFARQEHPFRGVNVAWGHDLIDALDAAKAWPRTFNDRLDLLDFMNSNGEFSDKIDSRIVAEASAGKKAFRAWVRYDVMRLARWGSELSEPMETPFGLVTVPRASPLRIVRNPAMRVKLFDLLPESNLKERPPRRGPRETLRAYLDLFTAYRAARKVFSARFLDNLRQEGSLENKFYLVVEEVDRLAREESRKWRERWDKGDFNEVERGTEYRGRPLPDFWREALPHEKDEALTDRRLAHQQMALGLVYRLYLAFAATQEPLLGLILENYPEPTRSRDELLERVMKARRLTPGSLSFLESNKSYRQPNPVRMAEKQLLDQAIAYLRRFKPADRVDLILHLSGVGRMTPERVKELDRKFLAGDRKKLARDKAALHGVSQLKGYLTLMHTKDRSMLVRGMFFGPDSLHKEPSEVRRLYEAIVIKDRGLPKFVEEVLRAHFRALSDDEKAVELSNLAGTSDFDRDLDGPEVVRIALKGMGVTGAKVAQVLATHRGLLPDAYADALEGSKDKAQDMGKMRAFDIMKARLEKLADDPGEPREVGLDDLSRLADQALPDENPSVRRRLARQVRYILAEEGRAVRRIDYVGPELGSGSIKVVYKVELKDGRVWVVKLRAPGALHRTKREFEIVETMVADLEKSRTLDLPGVRQLIDEVRALVRAEMDFRDEAAKESGVRDRAKDRPWYARLLVGPSPYVPNPHPVYKGEDILVEEFVKTTRFADLPKFSLLGPSRRSIARRTVDEGTYALLHDEWLEPDAHTGNRYARKGLLDRFVTRLVMIDLGQGQPSPISRLKPLMRSGLALEGGDLFAAADALMPTLEPGKDADKVRAAVAAGLSKRPKAGIVERLMDGFLEAEKSGALVKPDYAALQKAFLIYGGYSEHLPSNGLFASLERAAAARMLKDGKISALGLIRLEFKRLFLGRRAARAEMSALIEKL